jgi:chorismate-pyruvate lyase
MNWHDIVYDPGSTTKAFKILTSDYKLDVLFSDFDNNLFKRVIVINLDQVPVMVALSATKITNNLFLDILQNAHTTPIGLRLFAPDSCIRRGSMLVSTLDISEISDQTILNYLHTINHDNQLYFRSSIFTYGHETMYLGEYILPGLKQIIDKYNLN